MSCIIYGFKKREANQDWEPFSLNGHYKSSTVTIKAAEKYLQQLGYNYYLIRLKEV